MENEKNKDDYALNTLKDIWEYDRARLLDLGNDFQVLLSQKDPDRNEEARARSNFLKLVEDERRPVSHTLTDASRLLPDVIAALIGSGAKAASKGIGKLAEKAGVKAAQKTTKGVAQKLVNEGTSEAAEMLFTKGKLLGRDAKDIVGKRWYRDLLENKEAMERVAGRKLNDNEVAAIRKNIKEFVPNRVDKFNIKVDELAEIYKKLDIKERPKTMDDIKIILYENKDKLSREELQKLFNSFPELNYISPSFSHLKADRIIEPEKTIKEAVKLKDVFNDARDVARPIVANTAIKAADTGINDALKTKFETKGNGKQVVISQDYDYSGSEPTPGQDFFYGLLGLDFDDPTRFNEKDINAFMDFLADKGFFEKDITGNFYVSDFWTPRQKVSYIIDQLNGDKNKAKLIKKLWLESDQRKELLGE